MNSGEMFKAIGRWGSQVKNTLNVHLLSNFFGSKSKKYGDLNNDEEEIFCDAQEEISESESDNEDVPTSSVEPNGDISVKADINLNIESTVLSDHVETGVKDLITQADVSATNEVETVDIDESSENVVTFNVFGEIVENDEDATFTKEEDHTDIETYSSGESDEDDEHHVNHSDKKKIMKNSESSNGLVQSASAAVIQKVHRRMNSYSQRQYAKFDNAHDDENDKVIHDCALTSLDDVDNNVFDKIEFDSKTEKKTKRKKKIGKMTRKAVHGTWKWFKRSMVAYAYTFNFPSTFASNVAAATRK